MRRRRHTEDQRRGTPRGADTAALMIWVWAVVIVVVIIIVLIAAAVFVVS